MTVMDVYCRACRALFSPPPIHSRKRTLVSATGNSSSVVWATLRVALTLVLMAGGPLLAGSYPHGAPHRACWNMKPEHESSPLPTNSSPYELVLQPGVHTYRQHSEVRIRIEGTTFIGFMLQARRVDSAASPEPVGRFEIPPSYSKQLHCLHSGDTVTHANRGPKWNMEFVWRPPHHSEGPVYFIATVVYAWETYWMNVTSGVLTPRDYPTPKPTIPPTTTTTQSTTASRTSTILMSSPSSPKPTKSTTLFPPFTWPPDGWWPYTSPRSTKTLKVSRTTPPADGESGDHDVSGSSTTLTSRPIILDEDQFPLISAATSLHRSASPQVIILLLASLLISCSICGLTSTVTGASRRSSASSSTLSHS